MPIQKGDLVPKVSPVDDSIAFWEVVEVVGSGEASVAKMKPRRENPTPPPPEAEFFLVPMALLRDVRVYRSVDPFFNDSFSTDTLAEDYDRLGTNPRAWAKAIAEKHSGGKALDETALLGWCSRMIEAGAARERALAVKPPPVPRIPRHRRETAPPVPRPVRKERKKK